MPQSTGAAQQIVLFGESDGDSGSSPPLDSHPWSNLEAASHPSRRGSGTGNGPGLLASWITTFLDAPVSSLLQIDFLDTVRPLVPADCVQCADERQQQRP